MPAHEIPSTSLPRPAAVRCGTDALRVLFLSASQPLEPETLVFLLDREGNGSVITIVSGTIDPDAILSVAECIARAARGLPQAEAMVLATIRPAGCVLPGDIDRWLEASELIESYGVALIEWYIIGASGAQSPRDLLGEPERWHLLTPGDTQ